MILLRLGKSLALWALVFVLAVLAYMESVGAATLDGRLGWTLPPMLGVLLAGHVLGALCARRWPRRWAPLDSDRHALVLIVAALCTISLGSVEAHTSIKVLLEKIAPFLAWIYPALTFATPLVLRLTGHTRDAADQALALSLGLTSLSGALVLMDGPLALMLGIVVLLMQLSASEHGLPASMLLRLSGCVLALLAVSAWYGLNPLQGTPALTWILGSAALGLALAARARSAADWTLFLAAPVCAAVLVALCGVLVTWHLGQEVGWMPALRTRLTLFRQHPNFLAPYLAFHTLLALGLAWSVRRTRWLGLGAAALLAASTLHTTSRAGIAGLLTGLVLLPTLWLLPRVVKRVRPGPAVVAMLLAVVVLGVVFVPLLTMDTSTATGWQATALEWLEKSLDYRLDAWRNSARLVADHPWVGVGPHTFLSVERFKPGSRFFNEPQAPHPHNVLLYVAQAAGLPALLFFLAWVVVLLVALWNGFRSGRPASPRLLSAVLAGTVALLLADLLDVGLALDTVVPRPLFLLTGLVLGSTPRPQRTRSPLGALAWLAILAVLFVSLGMRSTWARVRFEQGVLLASLSDLHHGDEQLMQDARQSMRAAIDLDPNHYSAYKLLATWVEDADKGQALRLLQALIDRAPVYGPSHSLLGRLYMRAGMNAEAAASLQASFGDALGGVLRSRDRADAVLCLTRIGQRSEALQLLTEAMRVDVGVIDALPWRTDPESGDRSLPVAGPEPTEPIQLVEVVEALYARHVQDQQSGQRVGRRFWFDTYAAFRRAGRPQRALQVLDFMEANVPEAEPHSIAFERGHVYLELDQLEEAQRCYERAYELEPQAHFLTWASDVERARAAAASGTPTPPDATPPDGTGVPDSQPAGKDNGLATEAAEQIFKSAGEILDQPALYRDNLRSRAEAALEAGRAAAAADLLERTLLYEDSVLGRAWLWARIGSLRLAADQPRAALTALYKARDHVNARSVGLQELRIGYTNSLPGQLAVDMANAWHVLGLDAGHQQHEAWGLSDFYGSGLAPALFRLAFFAENGRPDLLLREAEMQLLTDPGNVLAMWARLEAIEGLGLHPELPLAMRDITEYLGRGSAVARLSRELEASMPHRMKDPEAWNDGAVLTMLSGRYSEAADLFAQARALTSEDHAAAHIAGWQARALLLAEREDNVAQARAVLEQAIGLAPGCGILRRRLETMP